MSKINFFLEFKVVTCLALFPFLLKPQDFVSVWGDKFVRFTAIFGQDLPKDFYAGVPHRLSGQ